MTAPRLPLPRIRARLLRHIHDVLARLRQRALPHGNPLKSLLVAVAFPYILALLLHDNPTPDLDAAILLLLRHPLKLPLLKIIQFRLGVKPLLPLIVGGGGIRIRVKVLAILSPPTLLLRLLEKLAQLDFLLDLNMGILGRGRCRRRRCLLRRLLLALMLWYHGPLLVDTDVDHVCLIIDDLISLLLRA